MVEPKSSDHDDVPIRKQAPSPLPPHGVVNGSVSPLVPLSLIHCLATGLQLRSQMAKVEPVKPWAKRLPSSWAWLAYLLQWQSDNKKDAAESMEPSGDMGVTSSCVHSEEKELMLVNSNVSHTQKRPFCPQRSCAKSQLRFCPSTQGLDFLSILTPVAHPESLWTTPLKCVT